MNTQSFTNGTSRLSRAVRRLECGTHLCYELSTSQFSDMKVRRLTRQYGFFGYSIYRYLVNETLHNGSYLLLWCEETAQYWNASLEDVTRIVNGCIQVGLFNDELFRKHWGLTSADIQRLYGPCQVLWHALPVSWYPQGVRTFGQLMYYPL